MRLEDLKVAIIGLGYVGLPLAVEFGKQRPVVGFDISEKRIAELMGGVATPSKLVQTSSWPQAC